MTYQETISWMFAQLPMYQKKGAAALKHKLDNILHFSEVLGNPHRKFKSIHVAGTNGKGSSSHMLASILQEAGYKVGLYTSPHLKDFRERIKINGKPIGKDYVKDFIKAQKPFLEANELSFFEMTVGMAFTYFAEEKVDIAIIEVGLGGRLDSTNIIQPEVSLITNIGYDHMELLGNTLEKIALEKAGIIKENTPIVISERQSETEGIFRLIAAQKNSEIVFAEDLDLETYPTDLLGDYQRKNMTGVLAAIQMLKGFEISKKDVKKGLSRTVKNTGILGRWQVLGKKPLMVCDTAHNQEGLMSVMEQVGRQKYKKLHFVLGFVNDKELKKLLRRFPQQAEYYFVSPNIPRGLAVEELESIAKEIGLYGTSFSSVAKGFKAAKANASKEDFIYVGGSTFVVAEIV
ncbi:bifunctional folylpolyglutamate synthase/dihydrofolate synthase [Flagellimonas allohymeniacidonis]|uniref:Dihydrofolate synthase/folylpolyglutamate synthase n=1 Tax=Flagellimonas allohymeniacidonis TaxID=2517819 RepID=A0A4Q8QGT0_9FLAO|nr:folylpolyglutamate synthase/dihydrofolate synthase family protein [Allomuricauda hymeniacidonis]TAI49765.1 bifunctional folylpolyglutamate synthase/dihydrofolate synthase [Allomuricauda hymeniacidonis]